jgi:hypothetical protein
MEVTVQICAWSESRDLPGLEPAFRARLTVLDGDQRVGVASRAALHRELDQILAEVFGAEGEER